MATFTLDLSPFPDNGYVRLSWPSSQEDANWWAWRVYRRESGDDWEMITQTTTQLSGTYVYDDYKALGNVEQQWSVVEVTSINGGQDLVEGSYSIQTGTPEGSGYWLIHPTDSSMTMKLYSVTSDSYAIDVEEQELLLIGSGRKVDRGDSWGISGQLTVKFRDNTDFTGREQKKKFEALRQANTYLYLRNPFGDVHKVSLFGGTSFDREAGIGLREFVVAGLEYREVA